MMISLSGYQITEAISANEKNLIYRGIQQISQQSSEQSSQIPVIIKTLASSNPTLEEITRLKQEYTLMHSVNIPGIVQAYELKRYQNSYALILEDFGGQSLQEWIANQSVTIQQGLEIAIALVKIVGQLHQARIIHKDINPSNIIINPDNKEVKLTDFSIASRLDRENTDLTNGNLLEGTLAYMSPEQTGRMNRFLDYRTDFYSLGVTFYQLFTGKLPFNTTDPMEMVHCHLAVEAISPQQHRPELDATIAAIILKLLSKTAEDRYQTAAGLQADLETCLSELQTTGMINSFPPGMRDRASVLLIPQKLYGREAEVQTLLDAFERVSKRTSEIMLVSGYSGVGKTSVVYEIHKPIVKTRGYFIAGKFDQYDSNIPYAAIIQAFQKLIRQLLTEPSQNLKNWQQKILGSLKQNAQVIIDVIPELELILGEQPPVPQLGIYEAQNRFHRVFREFINVFCQAEHPLVIFLDDLQWADPATLKLLEFLMTDPDHQYLFVIGAYRENEVSPTHLTMQTLETIKASGTFIHNIELKPLSHQHIRELIADTLKADPENHHICQLALLIENKTQGNPFFLTQILKTLATEKLLNYDLTLAKWQWDIAKIQGIGITDYNVVQLIARNLSKLPEDTQKVLKFAACIGNQFNLDILAIVNEQSTTETALKLWNALELGLVLPLSDAYKITMLLDSDSPLIPEHQWAENYRQTILGDRQNSLNIDYKFLHDRVQQAAYSLIPESEKQLTHLKIGRLLLANLPPDTQKNQIFTLVNQLNLAIDLIENSSEKYELAALNLMAAKKAKSATAYKAALNYLNIGLNLLEADSWDRYYDLTLNLYVQAGEIEYLSANPERGNFLAALAIAKAKSILDIIPIYEVKMQFYVNQSQAQKALETAEDILAQLKIQFPHSKSQILKEIRLLKEELSSRLPATADLINLPEMTDPYQLAAIRILQSAIGAAFHVNSLLLELMILTMVKLCVVNGNSPLATYAYVNYAMILSGFYGQLEKAYEFARVSLALMEQYQDSGWQIDCKVMDIIYVLILPVHVHLKETIAPLFKAWEIGMNDGDLEYGFYCLVQHTNHMFFSGHPLNLLIIQQKHYLELIKKSKLEFHSLLGQLSYQMVFNLIYPSQLPLCLGESSQKEAEIVQLFEETNNITLLLMINHYKTILAYLFKFCEPAANFGELTDKYKKGGVGSFQYYAHNFYYSLALLANLDRIDVPSKQRYLKIISANQKQMKLWAAHCPENFQHKYDLVEAERAKFRGRDTQAIAHYEKAIAGARQQGYIQEEALANELAGEFHLSRDRENMGRFYITEAHQGYLRWGAIAKVKQLETQYPEILGQIAISPSQSTEITRTRTTAPTGLNLLDLPTVMKAAQAISSEIVLSNLLEKLMTILLQNSGAQKGVLMLNDNNNLTIAVMGEVDGDRIRVLQSCPKEMSDTVPMSALNYVQRTQQSLVVNNAIDEEILANDTYILKHQPKSVLCIPISARGQAIGLLYLENNLTTGAFTSDRLEVLQLLSSQAAISLENARLYSNLANANQQLEDYNNNLEQKVEQRTQELQATLKQLQKTEAQLIQTEKMSSLGQMVAGIAHEINNPINFIAANLDPANDYIQDLLELLDLYQTNFPKVPPEIEAKIEDIDLEYLSEDLLKILSSMKNGSDRIRDVVLGLRTFSRLDEAEIKRIDIHTGLDSTLMILQHRLNNINLIKQYGKLPLVQCYAGDLNQVFFNILDNSIYALSLAASPTNNQKINSENQTVTMPTILVATEQIDRDSISIKIRDNGPGIPQALCEKIFEPFFTTKPVGSGKGLGLSISHQIIVEKHHGQLICHSSPGNGAEFTIILPIQAD